MPIATTTRAPPVFLKDPTLWIEAALVNGQWTSLPDHEMFEIRSECNLEVPSFR